MRKLIIKKEPYKVFFIKAALVFALIFCAGAAFLSRYQFGYDPQLYKCIPEYSIYLIDKKDTKLVRGNIYAFRSKDMKPFFSNGVTMLKYLRGMPGDSVEINKATQVLVNGEQQGIGLRYAEKLGVGPEAFIGQTILQDDSYWFMGTSSFSFDSRYWGTVDKQQVIGRAYPIF